MLYLVRHGETEWNLAGRFQGHTDSPLTALGRAQAAANGRALARAVAEDGFSGRPLPARVSPLGRARHTAELIGAGVELDVVEDDRLKEVAFGEWEGVTREAIFASFGGRDRLPDDWQFRAPGGESFEALRARVAAGLADLPEPALIVTHGVVSRMVRAVLLGLDVAGMQTLAVPQDGFFRIDGGRIEFFPALP